jgi:hypothetical protein
MFHSLLEFSHAQLRLRENITYLQYKQLYVPAFARGCSPDPNVTLLLESLSWLRFLNMLRAKLTARESHKSVQC